MTRKHVVAPSWKHWFWSTNISFGGELCKLVYLLTNEIHIILCHWLNWLLIKILLHILFVFTILITHLEFNFAVDIKSVLRKSCIEIYGVLHHRRSKEAFCILVRSRMIKPFKSFNSHGGRKHHCGHNQLQYEVTEYFYSLKTKRWLLFWKDSMGNLQSYAPVPPERLWKVKLVGLGRRHETDAQ